MTDFKSMMPMLMLGDNVSDKLKNAFMMEAIIKNPQTRAIASMMQAQTAGEESRKAKKATSEKETSTELLIDLARQHLVDTTNLAIDDHAEALTAYKSHKSLTSAAAKEALAEYAELAKDDRSAEVFKATFKAKTLSKLEANGLTGIATAIKADTTDTTTGK